MKKILLVLTIMFLTQPCFAYRVSKPLAITDYNARGLVIINENFERIWDVTNGRYNLNIMTTNPDGSVDGDVGDMILLYIGGNYYLEINVDGGTIWRGVQLTNTP